MLVEWWTTGFPGWEVSKQPGSSLAVMGRHARFQDLPGSYGPCHGLQADRSLVVEIKRPEARGDYWQFNACLRGPGLASERTESLAILRSAKLTGPARR
ncbi:MAG: hypothetical protein ACREPI_11930 [Candidatus Dormibacterales bacterium]